MLRKRTKGAKRTMKSTELILLAVLGLAVFFDLRERRIPNRLVVVGLIAALATSAFDGGLAALGDALAGMGVGLLVLLPFFVFRLIGAGDVKLMSVVGGFVGVSALLPITLYTFIAGGLLGVLSLMLCRSSSQALHNVRMVGVLLVTCLGGAEVTPRDLGLRSAAHIPYALAIAVGVVCWILLGGLSR